jgi:hypothetical protein
MRKSGSGSDSSSPGQEGKTQQAEEGQGDRRDSNAPNHCTLSEPSFAAPRTRPITETPPFTLR